MYRGKLRLSGGEDPDSDIRKLDERLDGFGLDQPITDFVGRVSPPLSERVFKQEQKRGTEGRVADLTFSRRKNHASS